MAFLLVATLVQYLVGAGLNASNIDGRHQVIGTKRAAEANKNEGQSSSTNGAKASDDSRHAETPSEAAAKSAKDITSRMNVRGNPATLAKEGSNLGFLDFFAACSCHSSLRFFPDVRPNQPIWDPRALLHVGHEIPHQNPIHNPQIQRIACYHLLRQNLLLQGPLDAFHADFVICILRPMRLLHC